MSIIESEVSREDMDAAVGRRIHLLMWDRKITQTSLAATLGMTQSNLSKRLRGSLGWNIAQLVGAASALNTTVAYLVGEISDPLCTPRDLNPEPTDYESDAPLAAVVVGPWASSVAEFGGAA